MPSTAPSPHRTRRHRRRRVHSPRGCRHALASSATYHPDGSLSGFSYGNGIVHSRTRNTRGLPARMWDSLWGVSRFDHSYAYDAHGNLTQLTDGVDYSENRFMAYDSRDRLTQANAPYLYGEEIFDYDALDNVRRAAIYPLGGGSYLLDYRFVYDANQRLDRINDAIGTLLWDYSHNALGETTWRAGAGNTWSYAWSAVGRMTQGGNESYVYDAHGHRSRATRSGTGSTRYQVHNRSGKLLYVEDSRDDQRIDYLHLGNKLIAQRSRPLYGSTATVTYHHTDHLGSASVETNASGTQTQRTLRTPYGSPYDGTYREGPGFAGHVTDTATNLTYMQQRYYDPVAMRFISVDPVDVSGTNGGNFNRYWYGNNNPYTNIDPDGRCATPTGTRICGNAVAIAALATTGLTAQNFDLTRVSYENNTSPETHSKEAKTVVRDANYVSDMAMISGDKRFITAFNKIDGLVIDGQDFTKFSPTAAAFTVLGGNINFGERYFNLDRIDRSKRFIHEVYHHDVLFDKQRIDEINRLGCNGWSCPYEHHVESEAVKFFNKNWNPEKYRD